MTLSFDIPEPVIWILLGFVFAKLGADMYTAWLNTRLKQWQFKLDDKRTRRRLIQLAEKAQSLQNLIVADGHHHALILTPEYKMLRTHIKDVAKAEDFDA